MINKLPPYDFLKLAERLPVVDVRSPKEFLQGHVPGAHNLPLFSDDERAQVGTAYTRNGNQQAILKGLEVIGPKLREFVIGARRIAPGGEILVHCWRGGMRSEAMAWLFNFSGMEARVLEGGYRAYRRHIRNELAKGPSIRIIGGMTGSGKTEILHHLAEAGEQVVDLENLAHHKGSAFGALGEEDQPTTEQFENCLAKVWMNFDPGKTVWIEDESLNVGKVVIPAVFFQRMRNSPLYFIELSFEKRVDRLVLEYGDFDRAILGEIILKIGRRMGGDAAKTATDSLIKGDVRNSIGIVLKYYDKTYRYSLENRGGLVMKMIPGEDFPHHQAIAAHLKTIR